MWIGAQRRGVQQHVIVIVAVFVSIIQGHKMLSMRLGIKILSNVPLYHLYSMYPLTSNPKHSNGVSSSGSTVQIQGSNNNNIIQKMMVF